VVVENRPGAAGNIAVDAVLKATPESGTLGMFGNLQITMNPHVSQLAIKGGDPLRDLVPVIGLADMILMLAVTTPTGIKTLDQFMKQARDKGPDFRIGIAGIGAPHHLAVLLLQKNAELNMTLVPYKGGPPMMADAAGGHLDAVITTLPVGSPMVAAGKLHWVATVPATPIPSLPGCHRCRKCSKASRSPQAMGCLHHRAHRQRWRKSCTMPCVANWNKVPSPTNCAPTVLSPCPGRVRSLPPSCKTNRLT